MHSNLTLNDGVPLACAGPAYFFLFASVCRAINSTVAQLWSYTAFGGMLASCRVSGTLASQWVTHMLAVWAGMVYCFMFCIAAILREPEHQTEHQTEPLRCREFPWLHIAVRRRQNDTRFSRGTLVGPPKLFNIDILFFCVRHRARQWRTSRRTRWWRSRLSCCTG